MNTILYIGIEQIVKVYIESKDRYYMDTLTIENISDYLWKLVRNDTYYSRFLNIVFDTDEDAVDRFAKIYKFIDLVGSRLYITDRQGIKKLADIDDSNTKKILVDYISTLS